MYECGDVCMMWGCVYVWGFMYVCGMYVCVWGVSTYVCGCVCRGVGVYSMYVCGGVCMCV
jgi:hypothetical protein